MLKREEAFSRCGHSALLICSIFLLTLLNAEETSVQSMNQTKGEIELSKQGTQFDLWPNHKQPDKLDDNSWTEEQKVSSEVLRNKLTSPEQKKSSADGLKVSGAWFSKGLDLRNIEFPPKVELDSCKIDGPLEFSQPISQTAAKPEIILTNCSGDNLKVDDLDSGSFKITEGKWLRQILFLNSKHIDIELNDVNLVNDPKRPGSGRLWLTNCQIEAFTDAGGSSGELKVEHSSAQDVSLTNQSTKFIVTDFSVKNDVVLTNCTVLSDSLWRNLHVAGSLKLAQKIVPLITLSYSQIDRDVDLTFLQESGTV